MSDYGWIITWQNPEVFDDYDDIPEVGVIGPRNVLESVKLRLNAGEGIPFVMRDDDGIDYYTGNFIGLSRNADMFAPLDDFGMPNAGCTEIAYINSSGEYEPL